MTTIHQGTDAGGDGAAAPPAKPSKASRSARRLVGELAQRHFGEKAQRIVARGGGLTNSVFELKVSQGDFIVRTHEKPTKLNDYLKEQWAIAAARSAGVPTPRVLEVGNARDGRPYMISAQVRGVDGRVARRRLDVVESLGHAAALLHKIRTRGFGPVFDWSSNTLSSRPRPLSGTCRWRCTISASTRRRPFSPATA